MKKNLWNILLVLSLILSGCSASENNETIVPEKMEEEKEPEQEEMETQDEPQAKETSSYLVSILGIDEDGCYQACDTNEKEYLLTLDENFPEEEKGVLEIGTIINIDAWEDENANTKECTALRVVSAALADETLEAVELRRVAFEKINGFSVDDSICAAMYAKQTVNIRKGPSTDYDKLGELAFGEEVAVTGMADNGWYRISYQEEEGYVSNNYLATTKPAAMTVSSKGTAGAGNESVLPGLDDSAGALGLPYSEAEIDAAMNSGDLQRAWEMNQANLDALNGGGGGGASTEAVSVPQTVEKSMSASSEFVSYLNSKREAAGLAGLEWSDSLAQTAKERSGEIVDDFSHKGSRNCSGEIITQTSSGDVSSWYNNFANSPGHNAHMMDGGLYTKVGAGVCEAGGRYYVVVLFDYMDR